MLPTVLDVYLARRRIGRRVPPTPLRLSPWLSSIVKGQVFIKDESANLTSSFKIRGALNAALRLGQNGPQPPALRRAWRACQKHPEHRQRAADHRLGVTTGALEQIAMRQGGLLEQRARIVTAARGFEKPANERCGVGHGRVQSPRRVRFPES